MVERVRNENGNQDPRFSRKELEQMFKVANTPKFRQETSKTLLYAVSANLQLFYPCGHIMRTIIKDVSLSLK